MPHWIPSLFPSPLGGEGRCKKWDPLVGQEYLQSFTNAVILKAKVTTLSKRQRLFKFSIVRCQRKKVPL